MSLSVNCSKYVKKNREIEKKRKREKEQLVRIMFEMLTLLLQLPRWVSSVLLYHILSNSSVKVRL